MLDMFLNSKPLLIGHRHLFASPVEMLIEKLLDPKVI